MIYLVATVFCSGATHVFLSYPMGYSTLQARGLSLLDIFKSCDKHDVASMMVHVTTLPLWYLHDSKTFNIKTIVQAPLACSEYRTYQRLYWCGMGGSTDIQQYLHYWSTSSTVYSARIYGNLQVRVLRVVSSLARPQRVPQ